LKRTIESRGARTARARQATAEAEPLKLVSVESDLTVIEGPGAGAGADVALEGRADSRRGNLRADSSVARRYRRIAAALAVTDVACVLAALLLARVLRFDLAPLSPEYVIAILVGVALWVPVFHAYGLYAVRHLSASEEFRRTIGATSIGALLVVLTSYWSHSELSRQWVALTWAFAVIFELVARRLWRFHVWRLRSDGRLALRTLIVGSNDEAGQLSTALATPRLGFDALGYVSTGSSGPSPNGLRILGGVDDLVQLIQRNSVDCVFVASSAVGPADTLKVVQASRQTGAEVRVSANLPQILASRLSVQPVGPDVMAISLKPVRLSGTQSLVKRAFDLAVATIVGIVSLPLLVGIAIAIKLTSRGPVLFRQQRVTKGGVAFTVYKFRTMLQNGDSLLGDRLADVSSPFFKVEDDPRLTKVGKVLRKLSLDELPQLLNVIKGDMSLVGPRPLPVDQVAANLELLGPRHEVPAGVTGWWQVNGRSDLSPEEALRLDLFYIENWSLSLDLYILLKTVGVIVARRGAY
jgi:exopolysaccharide biosynthesis polyprenyl glycosylphosphotransferase